MRTLDRNISTQYYERLLLSQANTQPVIAEMRKKTLPFQKDKLEFIKNPSVLEFLGLPSNKAFVEGELEAAILTNPKRICEALKCDVGDILEIKADKVEA